METNIDTQAVMALHQAAKDPESIKTLAIFIFNYFNKTEEEIPSYWVEPQKFSKLLLRTRNSRYEPKLLSSVEAALSNTVLLGSSEYSLEDSKPEYSSREALFVQGVQNPSIFRKETSLVTNFSNTIPKVTIIEDKVDYRDREHVFETNIKDPSRFRRGP